MIDTVLMAFAGGLIVGFCINACLGVALVYALHVYLRSVK